MSADDTEEEVLSTALDSVCNAAYCAAVKDESVCSRLSSKWLDLEGVEAVAVRSVQLLTVLLHHLHLPLLAVVTGASWKQPVDRATPATLFPPHMTTVEAISEFSADPARTAGIILNLSPLSVLLLFKEAGGTQGLIVAAGNKTPSSVGLPPTVSVNVFADTETAFISGGVCSIEGLQRCTLIGASILACTEGKTRTSVLSVVKSWAASLLLIGNIHLATAPDQEKQLYDLVCAASVASACAVNVCFDAAINRASCKALGLHPSEIGTRIRLESGSSGSSAFCLDGALATGSWTISASFWQRFVPSISVASVWLDDGESESERVKFLKIKKLQSKGRQVSVMLLTPTGAFVLPIPRHLTIQEMLYELRSAHRGLSVHSGALSSLQRELVPVGGLTGAPNMLDDHIVFFGNFPLFSPFSGFTFRVQNCLSLAVGSFVDANIVHLIASYIVGDEEPGVLGAINIAAENRAILDRTLNGDVAGGAHFPVGTSDMIVIRAIPVATSTHSPLLSSCKVRFTDNSASCKMMTFVQGDYITAEQVLPDSSYFDPDFRYLIDQRRLRAPVMLTLRVGRVWVQFTHAGKLRQLLEESLSVEQIRIVALGCYLEYVVHTQKRMPADCGIQLTPQTLVINYSNPMAPHWRKQYLQAAQLVPLDLRLSSTISLRIIVDPLKFALPQNPTLLNSIRHQLAEEISENVLFFPAEAARRGQYPCIQFLNNLFRLCRSVSSLLPSLIESIVRQILHFASSDSASCDDALPVLQLSDDVLPVLSLQSDVVCPTWLYNLLCLPEDSTSKLCGEVEFADSYWFDCVEPTTSPLACLHPHTLDVLSQDEVSRADVSRVWALPVKEGSFGSSLSRLSRHLNLPLRVTYSRPAYLFIVDGVNIEPYVDALAESDLTCPNQLENATVLALALQYFEAGADAAVIALLKFDLTTAVASGREEWPVLELTSFYRKHHTKKISILPNVRAHVTPERVSLTSLFSRIDCEYLPQNAQPTVNYFRILPFLEGLFMESRIPSVLGDIIDSIPECLGMKKMLASSVVKVSSLATLPLLDLAVSLKLRHCGCEMCLLMNMHRNWYCARNEGTDLQAAMDAAQNSLRRQILFSEHDQPSLSPLPAPVGQLGVAFHVEEGASILRRTFQCIPPLGVAYLTSQFFFRSGEIANFFAFPLVCEFMPANIKRSSMLRSNEFQFEGLRFALLPSKKRSLE